MQERGSFIHLVVSNALAPRVLLFRWPLAITAQWEKLASGFFDAPVGTAKGTIGQGCRAPQSLEVFASVCVSISSNAPLQPANS
eukprot:scaffold171167_cov21-Tisochrysis_lutea.AAC.1